MSLSTIILSVFGSISFLAVFGWAISLVVKALVEKGIQHKLDERLEAFRSGLRQDEVKLRDSLASDRQRLGKLEEMALTGMSTRRETIDKRRLDAIDRLWRFAVDMEPLRLVAHATKSLKMDNLIELASRAEGDSYRDFATMIWTSTGADKYLPNASIDVERLFVPPMVWAKFAAYRLILSYHKILLALAVHGQPKKLLNDPKDILELVKTVLPHTTRYVNNIGVNAIPWLIDQLTDDLLATLAESLEDRVGDARNIEAAKTLLAAVSASTERTKAAEIPELVIASTPAPPAN